MYTEIIQNITINSQHGGNIVFRYMLVELLLANQYPGKLNDLFNLSIDLLYLT